MRNILTHGALVAALTCGTALTQSTTPSSSTTPPSTPLSTPQTQPAEADTQTPRIAPGSVIPVELTKTLDAKKAKPGDEVVAKVTKDMKTANGDVLVAKNAKVVGHVTEARARSKEQKESEVGIAFDRAETRDGDIKLPMSIQAIIGPTPSSASGGGGSYDPPGPGTGAGTMTSPMNGRAPSGGASQQPAQPVPTGGTDAQARPPITGHTQGVIGMPDLKLEANAQGATQGSVVSSEKSNVKLESGTMMLLRVN
jgi:hypothetical protein